MHMTRPQGNMDKNLYEKILQEASEMSPHLRLFQPFLFGEALLHPNFSEFILLARKRLPSAKIILSTNGGLLDNDKSEAILEARIDKLNVDMDGLSAATAQSIRRHIKLERVKENIERFLALRSSKKGKTKLRISIIRMSQNRHEIEDFTKYWKSIANQVQIVDFNNWHGFVQDNSVSTTSTAFDFPCRHPYEELAISWNGKASLCCLDFDLQHLVGNVNHQSIQSIWRSEELDRVRNLLERGAYSLLPICRQCNASKFQKTSLWRFLWLEKRPLQG